MMGRKDQQRKQLKRLAIGSGIAAAAGYVAGVLTAPKSGKETRKDLKSVADKGVNEAEKDLKKLHAEIDKAAKEAKALGNKAGAKSKQELSELVDKAKDSGAKAAEVISAVRKGEADDKDLARAVKNATTALTALRKYLKK